jgi:hypothetical protein
MKLFKRISKFFSKNIDSFEILNVNTNDLKEIYTDKNLDEDGVISEYPTVVSLKHYDINALYLLSLVDEQSYNKICEEIEIRCGIKLINRVDSETVITNDKNHIYIFRNEREFSGCLFGLITDDVEMIKRLISLRLQTVVPWKATNLNPLELSMLQGKEEYYWNTFWLRFYHSLNENELSEFLSREDIPLIWKKYFHSDK